MNGVGNVTPYCTYSSGEVYLFGIIKILFTPVIFNYDMQVNNYEY